MQILIACGSVITCEFIIWTDTGAPTNSGDGVYLESAQRGHAQVRHGIPQVALRGPQLAPADPEDEVDGSAGPVVLVSLCELTRHDAQRVAGVAYHGHESTKTDDWYVVGCWLIGFWYCNVDMRMFV
jgi:hypothetical protein